MRKISLVLATAVALGLGTARAQNAPSGSGSGIPDPTTPAPTRVDVDAPAGTSVDVNTPSRTGTGTTTVDVNTPPATPAPTGTPSAAPGTTVDINTPPSGTAGTPPSGTAGTNVEITTPPATTTDVDVNVPPPATVPTAPTVNTTGAVAEPIPAMTPMPAPGPVDTAPAAPVPSRFGAGLLIGGGYEEFTSDNVQRITGGGGSWNARLVAGTRSFIGMEAAYVGSARGIDTLGLSSDAFLVGNGAEGALRLNVPIISGLTLFEPFGFVGVGWSHYTVTNSNVNTSSVNGSDDIMTVPYGGGLAFAYGAMMADARFTYRQTYYNDLMRTGGGNLNSWGVSGQVGFAF